MASATTATAAASAEPSVGAPAAQAAGVVPTDAHPAYAARVGRPGWEARWGSEEKERVAGAPAAAIAVEGAAAGFATAGGLGLDSPVSPAVAAAGSASSVNDGAGDHLMDDLPDGVEELKQMVVSNRRYFQEYLQKSLAATNDLRQSMARVDAELSSSTAKLAAEQKLRETLQDSFLEYLSRAAIFPAVLRRIVQLTVSG